RGLRRRAPVRSDPGRGRGGRRRHSLAHRPSDRPSSGERHCSGVIGPSLSRSLCCHDRCMAPRLVDPHPPRWRITEITLDVDAPIERAAEILIGPLVAGRYRLHKRTPTSLVLRLRGRAWWLLDDLTPLL